MCESLFSTIKNVTLVINLLSLLPSLLFLLNKLAFKHLDYIHSHANKTCLIQWDKQHDILHIFLFTCGAQMFAGVLHVCLMQRKKNKHSTMRG